MHFMNPVPLMKLVELIRGLRDQRRDLRGHAHRWPSAWARRSSSRDIPGFIVNRILIPLLNEAVYALHEGIGVRRGHRHRR